MSLSKQFFEERTLQRLVENQTTYRGPQAELHVFETHTFADQVALRFHEPVIASMLEGNKVMHLRDKDAFEFLPGQALVLPANEQMHIDFPEASVENPTRCLALTLDPDLIDNVVERMNQTRPRYDGSVWAFGKVHFQLNDEPGIQQLIHRLLFLHTENHEAREVFIDFALREFIIRLLQSENRNSPIHSGTPERLLAVITHIREHLHETLSIEKLSKVAKMSTSNFYRVFREEFGVSPVDYINSRRVALARRLLANPETTIKSVYLRCGFNSPSYFSRVFKRFTKVSPSAFRAQQER